MLVDDISELETGLSLGIPYKPNPSTRDEVIISSESYKGEHMNIFLMIPIHIFNIYRKEISEYIGPDEWNTKHIQLSLYRIDNNIINCNDFYVTILVNKWTSYTRPATIWLTEKNAVDIDADRDYHRRYKQHFEVLKDFEWEYFVQRVNSMEVLL